MRVTTNAIMRNYKSNLAKSIAGLDDARMHALTGRKFNSVAEDPASALRASILERKYLKNEDYLSTVKDLQKRQDMQDLSIQSLSKLCQDIKGESLEGLNTGTSSKEQREILAASLRTKAQSMVVSLNSTYGDNYIFAGTDGRNVPFSYNEKTNTLTYRGVDVSGQGVSGDLAKLDGMATDYSYVDLGFGMTKDPSGNILPSSAFNTSVPGIAVVGYGETADGDPKNLVTITGRMAQLLEKDDFNDADFDELKRLSTQFNDSYSGMLSSVSELGVRSQLLATTETRLEDTKMALSEQIDTVVNEDPAESLTNYAWAQYAYTAALKMGTSILSPSFIDFMR